MSILRSARPKVPLSKAKTSGIKIFAVAVPIVLATVPLARAGGSIGLTETIACDPLTGLALSGYDPVAYFLQGKPVLGSPAHEAVWEGAVFRFANAANRALFLDSPESYAPRFGGYDPVGVGRLRPRPGKPGLFLVRDGALYLFASPRNRESFLATTDTAALQEDWTRLKADLAP